MLAHSKSDQIRAGIERCLPRAAPWAGSFFRFVAVRYASRADLLSGEGSRQFGGRWNPPGKFNCVYGSLDPQSALEESLATYRAYGIPPEEARPQLMVSVAVSLQAVLDLTNADVQNALGLTRKKLIEVDWQHDQQCQREAFTQAIGRLAWEASLEGLLVPSIRAQGTNLVLFPGRRRTGSSWRVHGARDLPKQSR